MPWIRWAPTIIAFPIGGWIAFQLVGPVRDPLTAAAAAVLAGGVIGLAQGLALGRGRGVRWGVATAVGMVIGTTVASVLTGSSTQVAALALTGLITGLFVGMAQASTLGLGRRIVAIWTLTVGLSWAVAWVISASVIGAAADSGFITFGLSGALLATVVTGLVLRRLLHPARTAVTSATRPVAAEDDAR